MNWEYHNLIETQEKLVEVLNLYGENGWEAFAVYPVGGFSELISAWVKREVNQDVNLEEIHTPEFVVEKKKPGRKPKHIGE